MFGLFGSDKTKEKKNEREMERESRARNKIMSVYPSWTESQCSAIDDAVEASKNGNKRHVNGAGEAKNDGEDVEAEEQCDSEAWETLSRGFRLAQTLLDQNRTLIQLVNDNQRSRASENLSNNVGLIREINSSISKVLSIYFDLLVNFSSIVRQRRRIADTGQVKEKEEN